ncbi:MAG: PorP/SprF family type IX secretion system membrane protein [Bacteroidales bacterium]
MKTPYANPAAICLVCLIVFLSSSKIASGQQAPFYPVSYRIFNPFIFNPAVAGSKDFTTADLNAGKHGDLNSQIISFNGRLSKPGLSYFSSEGIPEFTNIGIGGIVFNERNDLSRLVGIGATGAYHLKLNRNALSFISVGASLKALFNNYPGDEDLSRPSKSTFFPNVDLGIYYYSPYIYAGVSATNLLGKPSEPDTLGYSTIPVSSHYHLNVGTKIILLKSYNLVIEPSLFVIADDSLSQKPIEMIKPALRLYAGKFCVGTYLNNLDNISFLFQFKYPKFHIGAYFEMQRKSPFYRTPPIAEIAFGMNLAAIKSGVSRLNHW